MGQMVNSKDYQDYLAWEKGKNSAFSNIQKSMQPIHLIAIVLLIIAGIYLLQQKTQNKSLIMGAIIVVVLILIFKANRNREKEPIPENIAKLLATGFLERKIGVEFEQGTQIESLVYCKLRYQGDWGSDYKPWKWELGFMLRKPEGKREQIKLIMHPYEGYLTGIVKEPSGYTGQDSNDLKVLFPQVTIKDDGSSKGAPSTPASG